MKRRHLLWMMILAGAAAHPLYGAYDYRYDSKAYLEGQFESSTAAKFNRGIINTAGGWTEIPRAPAELSAGVEHGALYGAVVGIPVGIFKAVRRTLVGVYEIATCYVIQGPILPSLGGDIV